MNTVLAERPSAATPAVLEQVLAKGDLSQLSVPQRLEYYSRVCESLGLNPLTRPFRFIAFEGAIALYATKDAADQLRNTRNISLTILEQRQADDLYLVRVQARTPDGRTDEDIGAVALSAKGGTANQIMRAITKAKRRVTLSICGLGFLDESELDAMPRAKTFAVDEEPPTSPDKPRQTPTEPEILPPVTPVTPVTPTTSPNTPPGEQRKTWGQILDDLAAEVEYAQTAEQLEILTASERYRKLHQHAEGESAKRLSKIADRIVFRKTALKTAEDEPDLPQSTDWPGA